MTTTTSEPSIRYDAEAQEALFVVYTDGHPEREDWAGPGFVVTSAGYNRIWALMRGKIELGLRGRMLRGEINGFIAEHVPEFEFAICNTARGGVEKLITRGRHGIWGSYRQNDQIIRYSV